MNELNETLRVIRIQKEVVKQNIINETDKEVREKLSEKLQALKHEEQECLNKLGVSL